MKPDDDLCALYRGQELQAAAPGSLAGRQARGLSI
jgi:hypothetical protein